MQLADKKKCTGCMACKTICPKSCINIEKDNLGHCYPVIDKGRCIICGKCQRSCPELNANEFHSSRAAYAAWSLDLESRKSSTSGGVAATFYEEALKDGFLICGVKYTDDLHVIHMISNEKESIASFKQSKYVYSESVDVYKEIQQELEQGNKVLFISLPCKVAGLTKYLGKKYKNLITVDIVCHGTPSYSNLRDHIQYIDKNKKASSLRFREDNECMFVLQDSNGNSIYKKVGRTDSYLAAFLEGINYRESCYNCSYARPERISDITICDFWGLGTEIPFDHPYSGAISAILINTDSGEEFFYKCKKALFTEERPVKEAIRGNAQLNAPSVMHSKRAEFEKLYKSVGFEQAVNQCLSVEMQTEVRKIRKRQIRVFIRKVAGIFIKRYRG